jgi:hypothetical protein
VVRLREKNWRSFCAARVAWQADTSKFLGRPQLPGDKDKQSGRTRVIDDLQALSAPGRRRGAGTLSQVGLTVHTRQHTIQQIRIVPRKGF